MLKFDRSRYTTWDPTCSKDKELVSETLFLLLTCSANRQWKPKEDATMNMAMTKKEVMKVQTTS